MHPETYYEAARHFLPPRSGFNRIRPMWPSDSLAVLLVWAAGAGIAHAQLGLPQVQLPQVEVPQLPVDIDVDETLSAASRLEARRLLDLRRVRLRSLVRQHRDILETDPNGAPIL